MTAGSQLGQPQIKADEAGSWMCRMVGMGEGQGLRVLLLLS